MICNFKMISYKVKVHKKIMPALTGVEAVQHVAGAVLVVAPAPDVGAVVDGDGGVAVALVRRHPVLRVARRRHRQRRPAVRDCNTMVP